MAISFEEFLAAVPQTQQPTIAALHGRLTELGCSLAIKEAKRGFATSYKWKNKAVLNWVFRASGLVARIYGDHAAQYESILADLPAEMRKNMAAAPECKRLIDPTACSDKCVMGILCELDGETLKKCRFSCMFFPLTAVSAPSIQALTEAEVTARRAAV